MKRNTTPISDNLENLAEDARALLAATADAAEDNVVEARKRLAAALESGRNAWESARDKAVEGVKVADEAIHRNPYPAIGVAFGVGALLGFLFSRRG